MLTEKDYCDYDTCITLEELGFPIRRIKVKGEEKHVPILLYEAQKWLRESKQMILFPAYLEGANLWICEICYKREGLGFGGYNQSYEEALSECIKEAIKILKDSCKQSLKSENTEYDYGHNVYHEEL